MAYAKQSSMRSSSASHPKTCTRLRDQTTLSSYDHNVLLEALACGLYQGSIEVLRCVLAAWTAKREALNTDIRVQMTYKPVCLLQKALCRTKATTWNHLEAVFFVLSQYVPPEMTELSDWLIPAAIQSIVANKHFRLVHWLHCRRVRGFDRDTMDVAAKAGSLRIVRFLHENRREGCSTNAMDSAAARGFLHIVKFLHANRHEGCTDRDISSATARRHWQVVRFLHQAYPQLSLVRFLEQAVRSGHARMVQELLLNTNLNQVQSMSMQEVLYGACERGHVKLVQWLVETFRNRREDKYKNKSQGREHQTKANNPQIDCRQVLNHQLAGPYDDPVTRRIIGLLEQPLG